MAAVGVGSDYTELAPRTRHWEIRAFPSSFTLRFTPTPTPLAQTLILVTGRHQFSRRRRRRRRPLGARSLAILWLGETYILLEQRQYVILRRIILQLKVLY